VCKKLKRVPLLSFLSVSPSTISHLFVVDDVKKVNSQADKKQFLVNGSFQLFKVSVSQLQPFAAAPNKKATSCPVALYAQNVQDQNL